MTGAAEDLVIVGKMTCIMSSNIYMSKLFYYGQEIYSAHTNPLNMYLNGWPSLCRAAVLVDKRVFFISSAYEAVSLLMDKAAIDAGARIEILHHTQENMVCLWANDDLIFCLSDRGDLDFVKY